MIQDRELYHAVAALLVAVLAFLLSEIRRRRERRLLHAWPAIERRMHHTQINVVMREETKAALRETVREEIGERMGAIRRELTGTLGSLDVKLTNTLGRMEGETIAARVERAAISERLSALHLATQALTAAVAGLARAWA